MSLDDILLHKSLNDFLSEKEQAKKLLAPYQGKKIVLYFYPKDDTPGCTKQACDLQSSFLNQFQEKDICILGVSRDDEKSHKKFMMKYFLTFPLLSDLSGELCEAFGVWKEKSMYGKKYFGIERSTFYIDQNGTIQKVWRNVKVDDHWVDVLSNIVE